MTPAPARVLVLGIDAADPLLVAHWTGDGTMPNLRALMEQGVSGRTRSVDGFFVGSTWPTWYTGVNPGRHGIHYLVQIEPGTYGYHRPADGAYVKHEPFWLPLSRAGKRVAVVDVPLSRVDSGINGLQVVEWGGHDAIFDFQTWPASLKSEISTQLGCHPLDHTCDAVRTIAAEYAALTGTLVRGARLRASLTKQLLARGGWDLFIQVFTEAHCAGHQCWHLHDPSHPGHDASMAAVTGDPVRQVYAAIDASIGNILADAGEARVLVFSGHGMSHWYGAHFLLPEILFRLGVAERPTGPCGAVDLIARGLDRARRLLGRYVTLRAKLPELGVDPRRSKCFAVSNGLATGGIRFNLVGREPAGTLARGAEADAFSAELTSALLDIVDERTGRPLVRRVIRTADRYPGEHVDDLPDLLVDWDDQVPTGSRQVGRGAGSVVRVHSPSIGIMEGENQYGRTGEHRINGFFVAAGPGIQPGVMEREIPLVDFAPTLAALLGTALPDADGRVIPEIVGG